MRFLDFSEDREAIYQKVMEFSSRKKLFSITTKILGRAVFFFVHEVEEFSRLRGGPDFFVEGCGGAPPSFLERMIASVFGRRQGVVTISFLYLERRRSLLADCD